MSFRGNLLRLVCGGLLAGFSNILTSLVLCLTIIGVLLALQHFKLLPVAFFPFSYRLTLVDSR